MAVQRTHFDRIQGFEKEQAPMHEEEILQIQQRLNEIESKVSEIADMHFVYLQTIISLLQDKQVFSKGEYFKTLRKYKEEYSKLAQEAEFIQMMKKLKKKTSD